MKSGVWVKRPPRGNPSPAGVRVDMVAAIEWSRASGGIRGRGLRGRHLIGPEVR